MTIILSPQATTLILSNGDNNCQLDVIDHGIKITVNHSRETNNNNSEYLLLIAKLSTYKN